MQVYKVGMPEIAISPLTSKIKGALNIGPTLWLIPGGSNIALAIAVMELLSTDLTRNLTIALTDERFGPYNHPDSNWAQLKRLGFDPKQARVIETLREGDSSDMAAVTARYNAEIDDALDNASTTIGLFGMGEDGHIAGILPGSIATNEQNYTTVVGYSSTPFDRLTITFPAIRRLSTLFLVVMGENKRIQIERLINQDLPLDVQPAQIIKQVEESYVYNDQQGGKE
jgi:6-phosphogluconolactonase